jgi:Zn-dependent M28 family amino/carboxypeptidase
MKPRVDLSKARVIVGAHYDVCEEQPGADDNASAVAGLLEIARFAKEHENGKNGQRRLLGPFAHGGIKLKYVCIISDIMTA